MTRQEQLNEAWCKYRGKCSTEILHALAFALRWCDEHPHWISVEDELPKGEEAICLLDNGERVIMECDMVDEMNRYSTHHYITHWMALPPTPEHFADVSKKISGCPEIPNNHTKTIEKGGEQ